MSAKTAPRNTAVYSTLQSRESEGRPIRVGIVGAGATGRAIALQLGTPVPGIRLAAIANRTAQHAERALREAGIAGWQAAQTAREADTLIAQGKTVLTDDATVLTQADNLDIIVEVTGTVDFAASVALDAFAHGKPVI